MMRWARAISRRTTALSTGASWLGGRRSARDQRLHAVAHEEVVLEAHEQPRGAGIALAPGPAAELQVDAPALVTVRPDDVQAPEGDDGGAAALVLSAQADVRAAPRHVGGDRHRPPRARARDDARLHLVVARVEDLALHAGRAQARGQALGLHHGEGAHQDRAPGGVDSAHLVHDRRLLGLAVGEDDVLRVDADHRAVRRDHGHGQAVELVQLRGGVARGARHPAPPGIGAQEVLQGHRAEDPSVAAPGQPLLGLQGRLQAVRPVPVLHDAAGELVHDLDAALAHEVVDVAPQQDARVQRAVELGQEPVVLLRHQAPAAQRPLHVFVSRFRELDVAAVFVGVEVHAGREGRVTSAICAAAEPPARRCRR